MKLDERLDEAFAALTAQLGEPPAIEAVARRRTRRRSLTTTAVLAIVALVTVLAIRGGDETSARSVVANGGHDAVTSMTTTVLHDGVQVSVPAGWRVLQGAECPGANKTILLGAGKASGCDAPKQPAVWAWLAPASAQSAGDLRSCAAFQVNQLQGCTAQSAARTVTFVAGTDVALVTGPLKRGARILPAALGLRSSLAYADPTIDRSATQESQPLPIATKAAGAYALGDCTQLLTIAGSNRIPCPDRAKFVGVDGVLPLSVESQLGSTNSATNVTTAKVTYGGTYSFLVRLRHGWSLEEQHGVWQVIGVEATDPSTPLPTAPSDAPTGCALVYDRSDQVVGCVHLQDTTGSPEALNALFAKYGGIPVYANATSQQIVGVSASGLNFVPNRLVPRIPELQSCTIDAKAHRFDPTQPAISDECRTLLHDWGMTDAAIDVTG